MKDKTTRAQRPPTEIVFVLRVRAGTDGWWGQLRRVDETQVHYVRDTSSIAALLQQYWESQRSSENIPINPE